MSAPCARASSTSGRWRLDRGGDVDEVGPDLGEHGGGVGVGGRVEAAGEVLGLGAVEVADRDDLRALGIGPAVHVVAGEEAAADEGASEGGHGRSPSTAKLIGPTSTPAIRIGAFPRFACDAAPLGANDDRPECFGGDLDTLAAQGGKGRDGVEERPEVSVAAKPQRAGRHRRRQAGDAGPRRRCDGADGEGGGEGLALARIVHCHRGPPAIGVRRHRSAVGVRPHSDRDQSEVQLAARHQRAGAVEDLRQRLERFEDRTVVGGMHDRRRPEAGEVDQGGIGRTAVELGEVRQHSSTHFGAREGVAQQRHEIHRGRPGGPGSVGLVAGQIGARHGDHAPRHNAGGTAGVGHRRDVVSGVGTGDDFERNRRFERQPPRVRGAGVEPKKQAVDPDTGESGGGLTRERRVVRQRNARHDRRGWGGGRRGPLAHFRRAEGQVYRLPHAVACIDPVGPGPGEWPAVGLERGVGPVALVLHLEDVALECDRDFDVVDAVPQPGDVEDRLVWTDPGGKAGGLFTTVGMADLERRAGDPGDRMQQYEAGAVDFDGLERRQGQAGG